MSLSSPEKPDSFPRCSLLVSPGAFQVPAPISMPTYEDASLNGAVCDVVIFDKLLGQVPHLLEVNLAPVSANVATRVLC